MAQQQRHSKKKSSVLPFGKINFLIFTAGLILIIVGYIIMAQPPVNGFLSRTLAPLILLFAYLIVIPYSIFYGHFNNKKQSESKVEEK